MTSVLSSIGAPANVKIFAWVRAYVADGCDCAPAREDRPQTAVRSSALRRSITVRFTAHLRGERQSRARRNSPHQRLLFAAAWASLAVSFLVFSLPVSFPPLSSVS